MRGNVSVCPTCSKQEETFVERINREADELKAAIYKVKLKGKIPEYPDEDNVKVECGDDPDRQPKAPMGDA